MKIKIVVFVVLLSAILPVMAQELIIGGIPEEGMRVKTDEGLYAGFDVDVIDYIMKELKIPYKILLFDSSPRLKDSWINGNDLDMVFTYSVNTDREAYLIYPKESHIQLSHHFFILKKNEGKIIYNTFEDFKGLKVGITQGWAYTPEFWQAVGSGIFQSDVQPVGERQIKKLLAGRFDIAPLPTYSTLYDAKNKGYADQITYLPKPLKSEPYYNTFVKKSNYPGLRELVDQYDRILKNMKDDGTLNAIITKYGFK